MAPNDFIRNDLWCVRLTDVCVAGVIPQLGKVPQRGVKEAAPAMTLHESCAEARKEA